MINKGIIVSIQGYHYKTISELAKEAVNAGCVALRVDKKLMLGECETVPIIGLRKITVLDIKKEAFITPTVDEINSVKEWCDYIAVDYRLCNNRNIKEISDFVKLNKLKVIADIETFEDYKNIKENNFPYSYIATTLSVFGKLFHPNFQLLKNIIDAGEKNVIAEGNFSARWEVEKAFKLGAHCVCIGAAISNIYKLTKKFTSIKVK